MKIYPIRGEQAGPECINVTKVYDWVVVPVTEKIETDIPSTCLPDIINVKQLEIFCCPLPLGLDNVECVSIRRNLPGLPDGAALVTLGCTFSIRLTLVDWRYPECPICCIEAPVTFWAKNVMVCLPEAFDKENITCELVGRDNAKFDVFCCETEGFVVDDKLMMDITVSVGIRVEGCVTLEVVGKFAQPRLPIPVTTQTNCYY